MLVHGAATQRGGTVSFETLNKVVGTCCHSWLLACLAQTWWDQPSSTNESSLLRHAQPS